MYEEDERLRFEVTDYDLESEFMINRHRKLTKDEIIYGVFGSGNNDDDEVNELNNQARSNFKKKKNYSAPVNFITGGIHVVGKKEELKEQNESEAADVIDISSDEDELQINKPFTTSTSQKNELPEEIAGLRKRSAFQKNNVNIKGVGNWEKHTKGIGAKLLLQMGYQPGKGLGKDLQGIQAPIEAHLRKGRGAIGAYGSEKKTKLPKPAIGKGQQEDKVDQIESKTPRVLHWKKEVAEQHENKVHYKTVEDIIEETKRAGKNVEISELSKVKVIDMTGPEQRVLSGYHAISGVQKPIEEWEMTKERYSNFSLPELQHNLKLLVDLTGQAIVDNDQKLKHDEDKIALIKHQLDSSEESMERERQLLENLNEIVSTIESAMTRTKDDNLTLEESATIFSKLRENYSQEFHEYEVPYIAEDIIKPMVQTRIENWNPLQEPAKLIPLYTEWKSILTGQGSRSSTESADAYEMLVWNTWIPQIQTTVKDWQCRNWGPMVDLIVKWMPVLTPSLSGVLFESIVLKRLEDEVKEWDPVTDCVPIHSWIYPWIGMLGKHFNALVYPTIRQKLSVALINWHPSDSSARLMLKPWIGVFSSGEMEAFIVSNIIPKLQVALEDFVISPQRQHLDNWNWVMDWCEMIPPLSMAVLLDKYFFPKWIKILKMWLSMKPDYDEVGQWYTGWKSMIPEPILLQPIVKDHLRAALDAMSLSVGGPTMSSSASNGMDEAAKKRAQQNLAEAVRTAALIPEGFKDLVQKRCEERGLLWMPLSNRYVEGKPVYRCGGKHQVYIDRNVLFASHAGGPFVPISMQELLDNAI